MMLPATVKPVADLFRRHYQILDSGCWLWTGAKKNDRGYGVMWFRKRSVRATHVSLYLDGRERPGEKFGALHSCDNPACVNPAHLRWGTQRENAKDASDRGRINIEASRANGRKNKGRRFSHCRSGKHELTDDNRGTGGTCLRCQNERRRERRMAAKAAA